MQLLKEDILFQLREELHKERERRAMLESQIHMLVDENRSLRHSTFSSSLSSLPQPPPATALGHPRTGYGSEREFHSPHSSTTSHVLRPAHQPKYSFADYQSEGQLTLDDLVKTETRGEGGKHRHTNYLRTHKPYVGTKEHVQKEREEADEHVEPEIIYLPSARPLARTSWAPTASTVSNGSANENEDDLLDMLENSFKKFSSIIANLEKDYSLPMKGNRSPRKLEK